MSLSSRASDRAATLSQTRDFLHELEASTADVAQRVQALTDALDLAAARAAAGPGEAPLLSNLKARLAALHAPLGRLSAALREGTPALTKGTDVIAAFVGQEHALRQKAALVEAAHAALDDERVQLQLDRDALDRERHQWLRDRSPLSLPQEQAPELPARAQQQQQREAAMAAEQQQLARQLRDTQDRLQRTHSALESKALLLTELQTAADKAASEAAQLRSERKASVARLEAVLAEAHITIAEQAARIEFEQQRARTAQQLFQREVLRPDADSGTHTLVRALSARSTSSAMSGGNGFGSGDAPRRVRDIASIVKQNETLRSELSALQEQHTRLEAEHAALQVRTRAAQDGAQLLAAKAATSAAARADLQKRLDRTASEAAALQQQLCSQADAFVRRNREREASTEAGRWAALTAAASAPPATPRARMRQPMLRSPTKHRSIPVQNWASP